MLSKSKRREFRLALHHKLNIRDILFTGHLNTAAAYLIESGRNYVNWILELIRFPFTLLGWFIATGVGAIIKDYDLPEFEPSYGLLKVFVFFIEGTESLIKGLRALLVRVPLHSAWRSFLLSHLHPEAAALVWGNDGRWNPVASCVHHYPFIARQAALVDFSQFSERKQFSWAMSRLDRCGPEFELTPSIKKLITVNADYSDRLRDETVRRYFRDSALLPKLDLIETHAENDLHDQSGYLLDNNDRIKFNTCFRYGAESVTIDRPPGRLSMKPRDSNIGVTVYHDTKEGMVSKRFRSGKYYHRNLKRAIRSKLKHLGLSDAIHLLHNFTDLDIQVTHQMLMFELAQFDRLTDDNVLFVLNCQHKRDLASLFINSELFAYAAKQHSESSEPAALAEVITALGGEQVLPNLAFWSDILNSGLPFIAEDKQAAIVGAFYQALMNEKSSLLLDQTYCTRVSKAREHWAEDDVYRFGYLLCHLVGANQPLSASLSQLLEHSSQPDWMKTVCQTLVSVEEPVLLPNKTWFQFSLSPTDMHAVLSDSKPTITLCKQWMEAMLPLCGLQDEDIALLTGLITEANAPWVIDIIPILARYGILDYATFSSFLHLTFSPICRIRNFNPYLFFRDTLISPQINSASQSSPEEKFRTDLTSPTHQQTVREWLTLAPTQHFGWLFDSLTETSNIFNEINQRIIHTLARQPELVDSEEVKEFRQSLPSERAPRQAIIEPFLAAYLSENPREAIRRLTLRMRQQRTRRARNAEAHAIDDGQSTHTASVHASVSASAIKLRARYQASLKARGLASVLTEMSRWLNSRQVTKQHEKSIFAKRKLVAAKRIFKRLCKRIYRSYTDSTSGVSQVELLAYIWMASSDTTILYCDEVTAKARLIDKLYECQRGANLDFEGKDDQHSDRPICAGGQFNKLMATLNTIHPDVSIHFYNHRTARLKFQSAVNQQVQNYLIKQKIAASTQTAQNAFADLFENLKQGEDEAILDAVREAVADEFFNEFSGLFPKGKNSREFKHYIEQMEWVTFTETTLKAIEDTPFPELPSSEALTVEAAASYQPVLMPVREMNKVTEKPVNGNQDNLQHTASCT